MATGPTSPAPAAAGWRAPAPSLLAEADLVAPVPLHWRRLFTRRYNQAQLLARVAVARRHRTRARLVPDLLRRAALDRLAEPGCAPRSAATMSGRPSTSIRAGRPRSRARSVLLVDDVLTTGATVEACARVLQRGGARHVDVLTLARVVRPAV